jgi:ABC-type dipeptide/oligopeptide/nickel transport system ATPase subunit
VFQDPVASLNPLVPVHKSVAEPLLVHTEMNAEQRLQCAHQLLTEVGLDPGQIANRLPSELSGGQCQRVAIARALALDPLLIVCDEALSSLDLTAQREITDLLLGLQQRRQLCLLFISHDYKLVQGIAHNIFSLDDHVGLR